MAVSFVGDDTQSVSSATSMTFSVPVGASSGDLMIVHIAADAPGIHSPPSAEWEVAAVVNDIDNRESVVWAKTVDSESTAEFTWENSVKAVGTMAVYSGTNPGIKDSTVARADADNIDSVPPVGESGDFVAYHFHKTFLSDVDVPGALTEIAFQSTSSGGAASQWVGYESLSGSPVARNFDASAYASSSGIGVISLTIADDIEGIDTAQHGLWHWGAVGPRMVTTGDVTAFSAAAVVGGGSGGAHYIRTYDASDGSVAQHEIESGSFVDDHIHGALVFPSDEPPLIVWARHNDDKNVRDKVGSSNADWSTLGSTTTTTVGDTTTYVQVGRDGDDVLVFTRQGSNEEWDVLASTDYAASFASEQKTFEDVSTNRSAYMVARQVGGVMRCLIQTDPEDSSVRGGYCEIDVSTGDIDLRDGTNVGNVDGTSLPLDYTEDLDRILTGGGGSQRLRAWDLAPTGNPSVLYSDTSSGAGNYKLSRWDGSSWSVSTIASHGGTLASDQPLGACFVDGTDHEVLLARESSGEYTIERWTTSDYSSWSKAETLATSKSILARPYSTSGANAWARIWRWDDFDDYDARIELTEAASAEEGSGSASIAVTTSGQANKVAKGSGSASIAASTSAAGTRITKGTGSASVAVTTTATGVKTGTGSASIAVSTSGEANKVAKGQASASVAVSTTGSGEVPASEGTGSASVAVSTSGAGTRTAKATAVGTVSITTTADGNRIVSGQGTAAIVVSTSAEGTRTVSGQGSASIVVTTTGTADMPAVNHFRTVGLTAGSKQTAISGSVKEVDWT